MTAGTRSRSPYVELAVPSLLLAAFGLTAWLSTFAGSSGDAVTAPYLRARHDGKISGVAAAARAIEEARTAVPNRSESDDGLLAGPLESVLVRYEPLGISPAGFVAVPLSLVWQARD